MAEAVLLLQGKFRHGVGRAGEQEEGVVTEAASPALDGDDLPGTDPLGQVKRPRRAGEGGSAAETGCPGPGVRAEEAKESLTALGVRP